ncbi:hypothetical protein D3C87_1996190 [compost metagenome]
MIMRGMMIGDSTNASSSDLPRICERASRNATGVPTSSASTAAPRPTSSERSPACIHSGEASMSW